MFTWLVSSKTAKLMRTRVFMIACVVLGIAAVYIGLCLPSAAPSASIRIVGYTVRGDSLVAAMVLTNTGSSPLTYVDSTDSVGCSVSARVAGRATNFGIGGGRVSTSWPRVVWPRGIGQVRVVLPKGTETWRCAIPVSGASPRERMAARLTRWGIAERAYPVSAWFVGLLPPNGSTCREIESLVFEVGTNGGR
jgi:hypothetical protein